MHNTHRRTQWRDLRRTAHQRKRAARKPPSDTVRLGLQSLNVLGLPPLGSFHDIKLHGLTFLQAAEALRLDGREMDEYIFAILPGDEAIAFSVVEPLYSSLFHTCCTHSLFLKSR